MAITWIKVCIYLSGLHIVLIHGKIRTFSVKNTDRTFDKDYCTVNAKTGLEVKSSASVAMVIHCHDTENSDLDSTSVANKGVFHLIFILIICSFNH